MQWIFLVIDEFAVLRIALEKEFAENQWQFKKNYIDGWAANSHIIMALQRPETSVLDGAIRDNYPVRINREISKMRISRWYLYHKRWFNNYKEIGQGYFNQWCPLMVMNSMGDSSWDKEEDLSILSE